MQMTRALNENEGLIVFNEELGTISCYVELHRKSETYDTSNQREMKRRNFNFSSNIIGYHQSKPPGRIEWAKSHHC